MRRTCIGCAGFCMFPCNLLDVPVASSLAFSMNTLNFIGTWVGWALSSGFVVLAGASACVRIPAEQASAVGQR